jgi:hypothetical protein
MATERNNDVGDLPHPLHPKSDNGDVIFYKAPMADLITRLRLISITTCIMSVTVLPVLIAIKNYDIIAVVVADGTTNTTTTTTTTTTSTVLQQLSMGLFAFFGASGSTLILDFVFGPYVMEMAWIKNNSSVANNDTKRDKDQMDETATTTTNIDIARVNPARSDLLQITTRSIFGRKIIHLINPTLEGVLAPYKNGLRPFANIVVVLILVDQGRISSNIPLYVHSELLDETTRQLLLLSSSSSPLSLSSSTSTGMTLPNNGIDREGLPKSSSNNNNNDNNKKKKKKSSNNMNDDDDDLW